MDSIIKFFKGYYSAKKEYYLNYSDNELNLSEDNYWDVVLRSSSLKDINFQKIEKRLRRKLPSSFKAFFMFGYSVEEDFDTGGIYIVGNKEGSKLSSLSNYIFKNGLSEILLSYKLIPFGMYQDTWYICLDMNTDKAEPSIVLFELGRWQSGKDAISNKPWFSNFEGFLKCITHYIASNNTDAFDALDAGHHFSDAYDYWSSKK